MVSLTLKVILHVAENDSKYRDVAPLNRHTKIGMTVVSKERSTLCSLYNDKYRDNNMINTTNCTYYRTLFSFIMVR